MLNVHLFDNESSPDLGVGGDGKGVGVGGEETASEPRPSGFPKASISLCSHTRCKGYSKTNNNNKKNIGLSRLRP